MALTDFPSFTPSPFGPPTFLQFPTGAGGASPLLLSNIFSQTPGVDPAIVSSALSHASLPGAGGGSLAPSAAAPSVTVQPGGPFSGVLSNPFTTLLLGNQFFNPSSFLRSSLTPLFSSTPAAGSLAGTVGAASELAGAPSVEAIQAATHSASPGLLSGNLLPGIGAAAAGAGGLVQALTARNDVGRGFGAAEAAAAPLVFTQPEIGIPLEIALQIGNLFAGKGGGGVFDAKRKASSASAQAGERAFDQALTQGVGATPGIQSERDLLAALGVSGLGDAFNPGRTAIAASLRVPADLGRHLLGGPTQNVGPLAGTDFEFSPSRISAGAELVTPDIFHRFLDRARTDPSVLDFIGGSGDVAFLDQASAEALGARNKATAQQAIRGFLDRPQPQPLGTEAFTSRLQARFPGVPLAAHYSPAAQQELMAFVQAA